MVIPSVVADLNNYKDLDEDVVTTSIVVCEALLVYLAKKNNMSITNDTITPKQREILTAFDYLIKDNNSHFCQFNRIYVVQTLKSLCQRGFAFLLRNKLFMTMCMGRFILYANILGSSSSDNDNDSNNNNNNGMKGKGNNEDSETIDDDTYSKHTTDKCLVNNTKYLLYYLTEGCDAAVIDAVVKLIIDENLKVQFMNTSNGIARVSAIDANKRSLEGVVDVDNEYFN